MDKIWKIALFFALIIIFPTSAKAATLSINPASGTFEVGDKITVKMLVSSIARIAPINAVSGIVSFPTSIFTVETVSKVGSILNFWVTEPNFSQGAGTLLFEGVSLGGWDGGTGVVVTVVLKATKPGTGSITFKSGQVLANDGQGTDVTEQMTGATYSVVPAKDVPKPFAQPEVENVVETPQPKPSLDSPEISQTSVYGEKAIRGTSRYPNSQVLLTFVAKDGEKVFITSVADHQGQFVILVPNTLKRGSYKVVAAIILGDLSNSHTSNEIIISIGNFFSDISWEIRMAILALFIVLIYLIVRSYDYLKKNKKLKFYIKKETQEAEKAVRSSFRALREDVGDDQKLKKDLNNAEDLITKEIEDIEKS